VRRFRKSKRDAREAAWQGVFARTFVCVCGEDLTEQVIRRSFDTGVGSYDRTNFDPPPNIMAHCSQGHYTEHWLEDAPWKRRIPA